MVDEPQKQREINGIKELYVYDTDAIAKIDEVKEELQEMKALLVEIRDK